MTTYRVPPDVPHSAYRYVHYRCRCDVCTRANTVRTYNARIARRAYLVDGTDGRPVTTADVPHGKASTYRNWSCRCPECTAVHSQQCKDYKRRQLEVVALWERQMRERRGRRS